MFTTSNLLAFPPQVMFADEAVDLSAVERLLPATDGSAAKKSLRRNHSFVKS